MPNPATTIPEKYQVHVMFDDVIKKIGSPVLSLTEALIVCDVYPDVHMTCFGTEFAGDFFLVNLTNGELYVFTSMPERPPHWELSK